MIPARPVARSRSRHLSRLGAPRSSITVVGLTRESDDGNAVGMVGEIESASGYVEVLGTLRLPADAGGAEATIDFYTGQQDPQSASPEDVAAASGVVSQVPVDETIQGFH